jgi:hypothetical protein
VNPRRPLLPSLLALLGAFAPLRPECAALPPPPEEGQDRGGADIDGPYLFEAEGGGWTSRRIVKSNAGFALSVERLPAADPGIEVPLPGRKVPLKVRVRPVGDPPPTTIPAQDPVMAVSDIEGNLDALLALLRAGKVVDEDLRWTFGKGHLVVAGDTFDRGLHVTECLWLLYELEARARAAGGAVHFLLGNHEVMVLTGDLRYVRGKYIETAKLLGVRIEDLHGRNTVLGRWLRTRNAVVRIGEEIFVHGGISPEVARAETDLAKMNGSLRAALLADAWPKPLEGVLKLVAGGDGLTWYRGYIDDPIGEKEMDRVLAAFRAKRVVVGHTIVERVGFRLGGRVLALDVRHAGDRSEAAVRDGEGRWHRLLPDGTREGL